MINDMKPIWRRRLVGQTSGHRATASSFSRSCRADETCSRPTRDETRDMQPWAWPRPGRGSEGPCACSAWM